MLDSGARQQILSDIAALSTGLAGLSPAPRVMIEHADPEKLIEPKGYYQRTRNLILIKEPKGGASANFVDAIALLLHEEAHHRQARWVDRAPIGVAAGDDKYSQQIDWFAANMRAEAYIEAHITSFADYRAQPLERHSFQVEQWVHRRLGPLAGLDQALAEKISANDNLQPRQAGR